MYGLTWTPDGRSLIFCFKENRTLFVVARSGRRRKGRAGGRSHGRLCCAFNVSGEQHVGFLSLPRCAESDVGARAKAEARELSNDEYHKWSRLSPIGSLRGTR